MDDDNFEYKNYYSITPLKQTKFLSLKTQNISKKNNNDINPILNNKMKNNYKNKLSYTPIVSKKSSNQKPIINNFNYDLYNNNFYFNEDNTIKGKEINYKNQNIYNGIELVNRNNINHINDNFYESKMFSVNNSNNNINNKSKKSNIDRSNRKNLDISSLYSDRFFNIEKNNKSFSINKGFYSKKRKNNNNLNNNGNFSRYNIHSNNQSFYSTNIENNRTRNKGCFLLFEKSSVNKLKDKLGALNKYNTNEIDTLDIKDI